MNGPRPGGDPAPAPLVSIALPAFNAAGTLSAAIESVQAQTLGAWELIVVDDGSNDETRSIAQTFADADERITVIGQPNAGPGAARDAAIRQAASDWIVRLDADDILLPRFLERVLRVVGEHPEAEIVTPTGYERFEGGTDRVWCPDRRHEQPFALSLDDALHGWCPVFTHSAFRRTLWERIGGHRPGVYSDDYDFWARALASGAKGWFFPEPLSVYNRGDAGLSARTNKLTGSFLDTFEHIADTYDLDDAQMRAVERRIGQLRRRERFRRATATLLGESTSERLAGFLVTTVNWYRRQRARVFQRS